MGKKCRQRSPIYPKCCNCSPDVYPSNETSNEELRIFFGLQVWSPQFTPPLPHPLRCVLLEGYCLVYNFDIVEDVNEIYLSILFTLGTQNGLYCYCVTDAFYHVKTEP